MTLLSNPNPMKGDKNDRTEDMTNIKSSGYN